MSNKPTLYYTVSRGSRTGFYIAAVVLPGGSKSGGGKSKAEAVARLRSNVPPCWDLEEALTMPPATIKANGEKISGNKSFWG